MKAGKRRLSGAMKASEFAAVHNGRRRNRYLRDQGNPLRSFYTVAEAGISAVGPAACRGETGLRGQRLEPDPIGDHAPVRLISTANTKANIRRIE